MAVKAYIKNPKSGTEGQPEYLAVPLRNEPLSPTKARVTALERQEYNISQANNTTYASLTEAIAAVSDDKYKAKGLVLTFNTGSEWVSKRYNGEDSSGFSDELNWVDVGGGIEEAPKDDNQYARKNGAWAVIEASGGSSEHTLDLSPLFNEEGSPVATVSDEFLAEVKKAYEGRYSNALFMASSIPMIIGMEESDYAIILTNTAPQNGSFAIAGYLFRINSVSKEVSMSFAGIEFSQSGSGTKALTDNGEYAEFAKPSDLADKADKVSVVSGGSGTVTKQLNSNTLYEFGECTSLTITLAAEISGIRNEYMFEFVSGSTPTQLFIPAEVKWSKPDGSEAEPPTIEANTTYEISIVNNKAMIGGW